MSNADESGADDPPALQDPDAARPVPGAWRPMLRAVVTRLTRGDFALAAGVDGVASLAAADAEQMRAYVAGYGATLVELPDDVWRTSVAQWTGGTHWQVLVDLWTAEEGRSDLVLEVDVEQTGAGPRAAVRGVYVP